MAKHINHVGNEWERRCACCKKIFSTYSAGLGWLYKTRKTNGQKWYCSYECYMKAYRRPLEEKYRKAAKVYEQD